MHGEPLGFAAYLIEQLLHIKPIRVLGYVMPQRFQETVQIPVGDVIRVFMYPAQCGNFVLHHQPRYRFIRLDHEHFDNRMAEAGVRRRNVDHAPLVIVHRLHLRQLQHDHALPQPPRPNAPREIVHLLKQCQNLGTQSPWLTVQCRARLFVRQTLGGTNDRVGEPRLEHIPVAVVGDKSALGQAGFPLLQRAHAVGQHLRQHRDHRAMQIDTVAPLHRFRIERRTRGDKM